MKFSFNKTRRRLHRLPHPWRMLTGVALVAGGVLGFLPILGFWMIPLGLIVLSADFPWARRAAIHLRIWWRRTTRRRANPRNRQGS